MGQSTKSHRNNINILKENDLMYDFNCEIRWGPGSVRGPFLTRYQSVALICIVIIIIIIQISDQLSEFHNFRGGKICGVDIRFNAATGAF